MFCDLDAVDFIDSCPKNSVFKKKNLEVSPLEMTMKVKVEDLSSDLNSDFIMLYFEKYGEVDGDVEMLEDDESAIITFKTHAGKCKFKLHKVVFQWYP